jgi:hypothetical protein
MNCRRNIVLRLDLWRYKEYFPSKRWKSITLLFSVRTQKIRNISGTAVRTTCFGGNVVRTTRHTLYTHKIRVNESMVKSSFLWACHGVIQGEQKYRSTHFEPRHWMELRVLHDPAALTPRKSPGIHWIRGWVGSRTGLDVWRTEISLDPTGIRTLDRPVCSVVSTPNTLSRPHIKINRPLLHKHSKIFKRPNIPKFSAFYSILPGDYHRLCQLRGYFGITRFKSLQWTEKFQMFCNFVG